MVVADFMGLQSMVVCQHGVPTHSGNFRSHGFSLQYLRFSCSLEGIHPTWCGRTKRSPHTGP